MNSLNTLAALAGTMDFAAFADEALRFPQSAGFALAGLALAAAIVARRKARRGRAR